MTNDTDDAPEWSYWNIGRDGIYTSYTPRSYEGVDAETARQMAEELLEAAEMLERGVSPCPRCQQVTEGNGLCQDCQDEAETHT